MRKGRLQTPRSRARSRLISSPRCIAYVPDLGKDLIREFWYARDAGKISFEINCLPSGLSTGKPDGPRYIEFHPKFNIAYVVNELSSTVAVFSIDRDLLLEISMAARAGHNMERFKGRSTLKLIQSIKTVPVAFPTTMNTCGRICKFIWLLWIVLFAHSKFKAKQLTPIQVFISPAGSLLSRIGDMSRSPYSASGRDWEQRVRCEDLYRRLDSSIHEVKRPDIFSSTIPGNSFSWQIKTRTPLQSSPST